MILLTDVTSTTSPGWGSLIGMYFIFAILLCVGLAFIPANIAKNKGRSFAGYWWFGFGAFIPAIIVVNVLPDLTV